MDKERTYRLAFVVFSYIAIMVGDVMLVEHHITLIIIAVITCLLALIFTYCITRPKRIKEDKSGK